MDKINFADKSMGRPDQPRRNRRGGGGGGYKGVRMRKWGKWVAEVRQPNSRDRIWLGSYEKPEEAARAYDAAMVCLRGPSVALNFPDNPPPGALEAAGDELSRSQIQVAASKHARGQSSAVATPESAAADSSRPAVQDVRLFEERDGENCVESGGEGSGGLFGTSRLWNF